MELCRRWSLMPILLMVAVFPPLAAATMTHAAESGSWTLTGSMNTPRMSHTMTLLQNGKALVAGGDSGGSSPNTYTQTAELYDPASGAWKSAASLSTRRALHTATLLSGGRVLVAGGGIATPGGGHTTTRTAEVYEPARDKWQGTGAMREGRHAHAATLLPNGNVLITGGVANLPEGNSQIRPNAEIKATAELYNPTTGGWRATASMTHARYAHTATLLPNNKVLVAGGAQVYEEGSGWRGIRVAELYDPTTGTWSLAGTMNDHRVHHTATLLQDGKVLVVGGESVQAGGSISTLTTAELYDSTTNTWTMTGSLNSVSGVGATATLLPNGKVLVTPTGNPPTLVAELYDPATGTWSTTGSTIERHTGARALLLPNGLALIAGGLGLDYITAKSELYTP